MADPWQMDWGKITTEYYHEQLKLALHIFSHHLESEKDVRRTIRFVAARLKRFEGSLPAGSRQAIRFDDEGRNVSPQFKQAIRAVLDSRVTSIVFTSEPKK